MSQCPSPQQLEQLLEEKLADAEHRTLSAHVSACAACQAILERLTGGTDVVASSRPVALRKEHAPGAVAPFLARLQQTNAHALLTASRPGDTTSRPRENDPIDSGIDLPTIPGYEIVGALGRGGMGVVYEARQTGLNRRVALKIILGGPNALPKDLARFRQEAEAVARLHHPNIVQNFDIGEARGIAFLALELVEGGSLSQWLRGDPQPLEPTVRLVETLALAMHFAHQRGVVHRDLKPSNVLLQTSDSRSLLAESGKAQLSLAIPKIADFGLAKRLDEQNTGPTTGEIVGTPSYMAPEQAAGKTQLIGVATDVYALGTILYEMLTGRPPFKGATTLDTVVQVLHEEPVRPSGLRPNLPHDLETITLKCLGKEPARRYASAEALAEDLQRFRKGRPILARPAGLPERIWKWARRRPLVAALLAGMLFSVVLGFGGVTWQWQEARQARDIALEEKRDKELHWLQAEHARGVAFEERSRAELAFYYIRIAQSQLEWRVNNVAGAVQSLARCVAPPDREDQRGWEWSYLQGLYHSDLFTLHHGSINDSGQAVFHPTGRSIASVVGGRGGEDEARPGDLCIWDASTGALLQSHHVSSTAHRLAKSRITPVSESGRWCGPAVTTCRSGS